MPVKLLCSWTDRVANKLVQLVLCENVWLWRRRPTVGDVWFSRRRRLRRTRGRLAFVLVVWIDGKFFRIFGNGISFAVRNWTESGWYIRIYYCPLLFLRDTSRNRGHHTEVAVNCVILVSLQTIGIANGIACLLPFSPCERFVGNLRQQMCGAQVLSWSPILHPKYRWFAFFTIAVLNFLCPANVTSPQM